MREYVKPEAKVFDVKMDENIAASEGTVESETFERKWLAISGIWDQERGDNFAPGSNGWGAFAAYVNVKENGTIVGTDIVYDDAHNTTEQKWTEATYQAVLGCKS